MMGRSFTLGQYAGIPVKVHWTFGLLFLFMIYVGVERHQSISELVFFLLTFLTLFFCVVLHEYGHALTAKQFNVNTRDIIISPIGGVARLERLPVKPKEELLVAIAGPMVNVVIAILCFVGIASFAGMDYFIINDRSGQIDSIPKFVVAIFFINVVLFFFNLIPAFPMDGGRILRALLSMKLGKTKSTKIASLIGKMFAVAFMCYGLYISHYVLVIIGGFIYFMANTENKQVILEDRLHSTKIDEIKRGEYTTLYLHDSMEKAVNLSLKQQENNFLVSDLDGNVIGILHNLFIKDAIQDGRTSEPVSTFTSSKFHVFSPELSIYDARNKMNEFGLSIVGVGHSKEEIVGVIDRDSMIHFMRMTSK
jgi:Zn-dependent protease